MPYSWYTQRTALRQRSWIVSKMFEEGMSLSPFLPMRPNIQNSLYFQKQTIPLLGSSKQETSSHVIKTCSSSKAAGPHWLRKAQSILKNNYAWVRAGSYTWVKSSITVASLMYSWCLTAEWLFWINCALMHALKEMTKFWMNKQSAPRRGSSGYSYSELSVFVTMGDSRTWKFHKTIESQG